MQEGEAIVLVASYGGDNRHPAWFLNLRDTPTVDVTMRGATRKMNARVASSEERGRLWARDRKVSRVRRLPAPTDREIPLVILEPVR